MEMPKSKLARSPRLVAAVTQPTLSARQCGLVVLAIVTCCIKNSLLVIITQMKTVATLTLAVQTNHT